MELERRQHDVRNVLGAMRGYAELLLEELGNLFPNLRASLERVLKAVASATDDESRTLHPEPKPSDGPTGAVLAVDDSADNRDLLARYLTREGHAALPAASGAEALALLERNPVDLVLLDLIMPGMDGGEVLRRIKDNDAWRAIPVIVISGRQDMEGIISCIEAGADDYLAKPFSFAELQARLEAMLRRRPADVAQTTLRVRDLHMDLLTRDVSRDGREIHLQPREYKLLEFLMRHAGQVVTRAMLLEQVWGYHFDPQTNVIDVHVSRLRQKIDKGFATNLLETVRGAGYRLGGEPESD